MRVDGEGGTSAFVLQRLCVHTRSVYLSQKLDVQYE